VSVDADDDMSGEGTVIAAAAARDDHWPVGATGDLMDGARVSGPAFGLGRSDDDKVSG
jgi:hypothetical protein